MTIYFPKCSRVYQFSRKVGTHGQEIVKPIKDASDSWSSQKGRDIILVHKVLLYFYFLEWLRWHVNCTCLRDLRTGNERDHGNVQRDRR